MADTDSLDTTLFDAIILGTGFTQTIVAAALARAGKTVLHLDENDYYGGESGAFGFLDLVVNNDKIEFNKMVAKAYDHVEVQLYTMDGEPNDTAVDLSSVLAAHKDASTEERIKAVEEHIAAVYTIKEHSKEVKEAIHMLASWATSPQPSATTANFKTVSFSQMHFLEELIQTTRKYNFDLSPKLLYSRGALTNLLISSGIGKYLEFKLLERTA
ncbi:hypothetical protein BGZ65_004986, partial [Modicella reniformis]